MADNVTLPGTGTNVASDDIGGVQFQRVKMTWGADGVANDASAANPLPFTSVDLATLAAATKLEDGAAASGDRGVFVLAVRQDSDAPAAADGDYTAIVTDETGRLKVAVQPGTYPLVTGAITANGQSVFCNCSRGSNIVVHMVAASLVGHNVTFEASIDSTDGSNGNWFGIQAIRTNANTIELATGVLASTPAYGWELSVNGFKYIRVRATAHTSGTATWNFQQAPYATEPIPAAQVTATQPVSGSVTVSGSLTSGGTTTNTPATPTASIVNSAASTNGTVVKASAGTIFGVVVSNTNAATRFLKLHNSTTITVGTTAVAMTIPIPPGAVVSLNFGPQGMRYGTGICLSITAAAGDTDATAVAAGEIKVNLAFI